MGLHLDDKEIECLQQGVFDGMSSINQTSGFTRFTPIFLNIEVKRQHAGVDPMVQLGVWVAAEYQKRVQEGYDRSMPVLAISVTGAKWDLYIAYDPWWQKVAFIEMVRSHTTAQTLSFFSART